MKVGNKDGKLTGQPAVSPPWPQPEALRSALRSQIPTGQEGEENGKVNVSN